MMDFYKALYEEGYKFYEEDEGWLPYELEDWEEIQEALYEGDDLGDYYSIMVEVREAEKEVIIKVSDDE